MYHVVCLHELVIKHATLHIPILRGVLQIGASTQVLAQQVPSLWCVGAVVHNWLQVHVWVMHSLLCSCDGNGCWGRVTDCRCVVLCCVVLCCVVLCCVVLCCVVLCCVVLCCVVLCGCLQQPSLKIADMVGCTGMLACCSVCLLMVPGSALSGTTRSFCKTV
jgi:hypothetical protein